MPRPSSIDKLPPEIREKIGQLRGRGWTIDQILDCLNGLLDRAPSRSALGRHIQSIDKLGERLRHSREIAEALVRGLGDAPESQAARLNIELLHSQVLDVFTRAADGEEIDAAGKDALAGDPEGLMFFAKTLDHLARAQKSNVDFIAKAEERAAAATKRQAATAVEAIAKEQGISAGTLAAIKAGIFGVKAA
jgi:hypothetical protein